MSEICLLKKHFHTLDASFVRENKAVHENMLKAWSFMENKATPRCFGINLQDIFRKTIHKDCSGQMFLIAALMIGLCLDN